MDREFEEKIQDLLLTLGITPNLKGFDNLKRAIEIGYQDPESLSAMTKEVYPRIAKETQCTYASAERTIRHAIEVCFNKLSPEDQFKYFKNAVDPRKGKLTNSEFVSICVMLLKNM